MGEAYTDSGLKLEDFEPGDDVLYVPHHVNNDRQHPDCEKGLVSSISSKFVFVRYWRHGILRENGIATDPSNLFRG
jgi:hypothetical protein